MKFVSIFFKLCLSIITIQDAVSKWDIRLPQMYKDFQKKANKGYISVDETNDTFKNSHFQTNNISHWISGSCLGWDSKTKWRLYQIVDKQGQFSMKVGKLLDSDFKSNQKTIHLKNLNWIGE